MPYLGNTPSTSFATVVKDSFSGDGSETAFTLSKVATTNSVSVFVENVRQEPTTAYAVSGTTLTFTAAPPNASNNIYVLHMNPTTTTTHPAAQALTATTGTFTSTVDVNGNELILDADADTSITADTDDQIDIKIAGADDFQLTANTFTALSGSSIATNTISETTSGSGVTIDSVLLKDGGIDVNGNEIILDADADSSITADTDDQIDIKVGGTDTVVITADAMELKGPHPSFSLTDSDDNNYGGLFYNNGSITLAADHGATGATGAISFQIDGSTKMAIDASGHVTMPSQSAFMAYLSSSTFNLVNGSAQTLSFQTEQFDLNADFASNTTFTAPVSGKYLLSASIRLDSLHSNTNYVYLGWQTSNRNIVFWLSAPADWNGSAYYTASGSVLCDMDANDTAYIYYFGQGGTDQADHTDGYFSGFLVA